MTLVAVLLCVGLVPHLGWMLCAGVVHRRELNQASGRAAAAEAALQQQAAGFEARLAQLQSWYNKQAAVVAQLRRGKAPKDGQVGFTNTNK
jgi:multidrug resistance efflux pump